MALRRTLSKCKHVVVAIKSAIIQHASLIFSGISEKDKIVFVVPNKNMICGGTMSISNMADIAKELFPDKEIYMSITDRFQRFERYTQFKSPHRIINLRYFLKPWFRKARVMIHVYDAGTLDLLQLLNKKKHRHYLDKVHVNILNQNQDFMPSARDIMNLKGRVENVSMTLAFNANKDLSFPYLKYSPVHVGAWFPDLEQTPVPYRRKENLCILSPDQSTYRDEIKDKLLAAGIECYDTWPVPFPEFCKIQQKAKWTISFGEGWDGYSSGQFLNGGIGFGVLQPNFTQDYFDFNDLPPFLFKNYEDMNDNILSVIGSLDEESAFETLNYKIVDTINRDPHSNSFDNVRSRWKQFYSSIGWFESPIA